VWATTTQKHSYLKRISFTVIILFSLLFQANRTQAQFGLFKKSDKKEKVRRDAALEQKLQFAYGEGLRLKTTFNLNEAISYFDECIRLDPEMAAAYFELSNIYHQLNDLDKALANAKKAAETDPSNFWYQMLYLETLEKMEKYPEALKVAEPLLEKFPNETGLPEKLALLYFLNRPGWTYYYRYEDYGQQQIRENINAGAEYLVVNNEAELEKPYMKPFTKDLVVSLNGVSVYKLDPKDGVKPK